MESIVEVKRECCERFDEITRSIYKLDSKVNIDLLEKRLIGLSKSRRGSSILGERIFFDLVRALQIKDILEVGGNDGRHSRRMLLETDATVHTFEPNPFATKFFVDILENKRFKFNAYGLSDENKLSTFNILVEHNGQALEKVNGCSSFGRLTGVDAIYDTVSSMMARGDNYIRVNADLTHFALWMDVEGFAYQATKGFGAELAKAAFFIAEVEYSNNTTMGANADLVINLVEDAGLKVIYRDFQNTGQCNIFAIQPGLLPKAQNIIDAHIGQFIADVSAISEAYCE